MAISVRLLGEFGLLAGDPAAPVTVPNGQATTLLKLLAVRRNRVVPITAVIDALWPGRTPDAAPKIASGHRSRSEAVSGRLPSRHDGLDG
jgi:DNA-binding SARP family transcriptional activator